jgi:hypothetical protein
MTANGARSKRSAIFDPHEVRLGSYRLAVSRFGHRLVRVVLCGAGGCQGARLSRTFGEPVRFRARPATNRWHGACTVAAGRSER